MNRFLVVAIFTVFIFSYSCVQAKDIDLSDHPVYNFENPSGRGDLYEIKVKATKLYVSEYIDNKEVTISYVVKLKGSLCSTPCTCYLGFLDKDGFQLCSYRLSKLAGGYQGEIKGTFVTPVKNYEKLYDVEIYITD